MNLASDIFTVPQSGTYFFSLSGFQKTAVYGLVCMLMEAAAGLDIAMPRLSHFKLSFFFLTAF